MLGINRFLFAVLEFRRELSHKAISPYLADHRGWLSRICMASGKNGIGAILDLLCGWGKMCHPDELYSP